MSRMLAWCSFISLLLAVSLSADHLPVQIQTLRTHSRLTFPVDEGASIEWRKDPGRFIILFRGLSLADLGVHPTEQKEFLSQFKRVEDPRLAALHFKETSDGLEVEGIWKFPSGKFALADPRMESFDYFEKSPQPRYVIDFWLKRGPTLAQARIAQGKAEREIASKQVERASAERAHKRAEEARKKTVLEDPKNFCSQPLSPSTDVFLAFLPVHQPFDFSRWFSTTTADAHFTYFEPRLEKDVPLADDARYVRLALRLYHDGNPALVLRTLDFLKMEHPSSTFQREMRFLRANALIKLNYLADATEIFSSLMEEAKDSPVALYSGMYLAANLFQRGNSLAALEKFQWLINNYSGHSLAWVFHLGAAESLFALKQVDRAAKEYQWVAEKAPDESSKAEGASRIGDLYLDRLQHEQALATYYRTLQHFKAVIGKFPSVYVNRGEALYQLGEYASARQAFEEFLDLFPSHPSGWRASFRLGEIYARQGGGDATEKARKWFYETVNRFPSTPGATLARIRLAPCGDHGGFDHAGAEHFFAAEAERFDGRGEVVTTHYGDFRGLARIRTQITFGREDIAMDAGIRELVGVKSLGFRRTLTNTLNLLFRRRILGLLKEGKKYSALEFYQRKSGKIPREDSTVELDYLLKLSDAASDLGLGRLAGELAAAYHSSMEQMEQGHRQGGRGIARVIEPDLEEQLRYSEKSWVEAKALWVKTGAASLGKLNDRDLGSLRELLAAVREESAHALGRELLMGLLEQKSGNQELALIHAMKAQLLIPSDQQHSIAALRISFWSASLEATAGDAKLALEIHRLARARLMERESLKQKPVEAIGVPTGFPALPSQGQAWIAEAELLERIGRWGDAAIAFEKASEFGGGGNRARYGIANSILNLDRIKNREKALTMLEGISGSKVDDFWKRLAVERLAGERAKRVNAMEGEK